MPDPEPRPPEDADPAEEPTEEPAEEQPHEQPDEQPDEQSAPVRERVFSALSHPGRSQLVVAVLLGVLGFAAVTQVRINQTDDDYSGLRQQELIDVLDALAGARQRAQSDISRLEEARDDLRSDTNKRRAALEQAEGSVDDLNILAGLVPVTGPGIRVTITESSGRVHQNSLLDVIQELRTVDAEAIQINGVVRVVAQTSIREVTGGFLIDGQTVEAPYLIEAIGEPAALAGALDTRVGSGAGLVEDGAKVEVEEQSSIDITAVREPSEPRYAEPADDQ